VRVRVDGRLPLRARRVADEVAANLATQAANVKGTAYLGAGAPDLVRIGDPRPHIMVPLLTLPFPDAVARHQLAAADVVVAMDREEASRLRGISDHRSIVLLDPPSGTRGCPIHTSNPFDASDVMVFLESAPAAAAALEHLGVELRPFDSGPMVRAVIEAVVVSTLDSIG
jgi:hypothetical protein